MLAFDCFFFTYLRGTVTSWTPCTLQCGIKYCAILFVKIFLETRFVVFKFELET